MSATGCRTGCVACLSSHTSARVLTVVPAVAVLLAGTGSGVGELTTTRFVEHCARIGTDA